MDAPALGSDTPHQIVKVKKSSHLLSHVTIFLLLLYHQNLLKNYVATGTKLQLNVIILLALLLVVVKEHLQHVQIVSLKHSKHLLYTQLM